MNNYEPFIIFCDSIKNPVTNPVVSNGLDIGVLSDISIEVKNAESINIVVEGCGCTVDSEDKILSDAECVWTPLACLSASNFIMSQIITSNGIFFVNVGGCNRLRIRVTNISGQATITGMGVR